MNKFNYKISCFFVKLKKKKDCCARYKSIENVLRKKNQKTRLSKDANVISQFLFDHIDKGAYPHSQIPT